jgi:hypothetical protein
MLNAPGTIYRGLYLGRIGQLQVDKLPQYFKLHDQQT